MPAKKLLHKVNVQQPHIFVCRLLNVCLPMRTHCLSTNFLLAGHAAAYVSAVPLPSRRAAHTNCLHQ